MSISYTIKSTTSTPTLPSEAGGRCLAIASNGRLWAVYTRIPAAGTKYHVHVAYSDDNGETWTEEQVTSAIDQDHAHAALAIDSSDNLHIVYQSTGRSPYTTRQGIFYNKRTAGVWGTEETVSLLDVATGQSDACIAIDSADDVHAAWCGLGAGTYPTKMQIVYRKRTSGSWGTAQQVTDLNADQRYPSIAVDSQNRVHLAWHGKGYGTNTTIDQVIYSLGPTAWATANVTDLTTNSWYVRITLDNYDQPHLVWLKQTASPELYYSKKTANAWITPEQVSPAAAAGCGYASIAADRRNGIHVTWSMKGQNLDDTYTNIWYAKRNGSFSAIENITNEDTADQWAGALLWAVWPQVGGVRTNVLPNLQYLVWEFKATYVMFTTYVRAGTSRLYVSGETAYAMSDSGYEAELPTSVDTSLVGATLVFGDGSDGDVTISVDTTLTRDMFYNNLTVNAGITLTTAGYRIFVKNTLTNRGTIQYNGNVGGNATATSGGGGGAGLAEGSLGGSTAGGPGGKKSSANSSHGGGGGSGGGVILIVAKTMINNGTISANGGNGGNANGVGEASTTVAPGAGGEATPSIGSSGGAGGAGSGIAGAAGGVATAPAASQGGYRALPMAILLHTLNVAKTGTDLFVGGGGGGGGGYSLAGASNAGGGGGGGGGAIVIIYNEAVWWIETATAGLGGTKYGTGSDGVAGTAGVIVKLCNA